MELVMEIDWMIANVTIDILIILFNLQICDETFRMGFRLVASF